MKKLLDEKNSNLIIIVLFFIVTVTQSSTDIYIPALPRLSQYFEVPAAEAQLTITAFFLGYFASLLISGPLSDCIGRRKVLFSGGVIFLIGNLICIFSNSIYLLIAGRLIVGIGIAPAPVIVRATAGDLFQGNKLLRILNFLGLSLVLSLLLAPSLGALILTWIGWRYIFVFLLGYASLIFGFAYFCLPNTHIITQNKLKSANIFESYPKLLKNREFVTHVLCSAFAFSGFIIYLQLSPFIFESHFKFSALEYGAMSIVIASAYLSGTIFTHYVSKDRSIRVNMFFIALIMIVMGIVLITLGEFNHYKVWLFLTPVYIYITCFRIIFTFSGAKSLQNAAPHTGSAASMLTMANAGISVVASYLIHFIKYNEIVVLGSYFIISTSCIVLLFLLCPKTDELEGFVA